MTEDQDIVLKLSYTNIKMSIMIFNLLTTLYFQTLMKYIPTFNQKQVKTNTLLHQN